ncbi:MAG: two-component regulator propeller domain-containing protein [Flavobacteriales bacterium]
MKKTLVLFGLILSLSAYTQQVEIGSWKDYLPYENGRYLAEMNDEIYVATQSSIFHYHPQEQRITRLGKTNGLSDVNISVMKKWPENDLLVVGYQNANIDLVSPNEIYNLSDIERANIIGLKNINNISFYENDAYLSCSFGIVVLDLVKKEVKNTYYLNSNQSLNVNDLLVYNNSIYAGTDSGIYIGEIQDNLSDYQKWVSTSVQSFVNSIETNGNNIYFKSNNDSIFKFRNQQKEFVVETENLREIKAIEDKLFILSQSNLHFLNQDNVLENIAESSYLYKANDLLIIDDEYWVADGVKSLVKLNSQNRFSFYLPQGPKSDFVYSLSHSNDKLFVSPGGISITWDNNNTYKGFYWNNGYQWNSLNYYDLGPVDIRDITNIIEGSGNDLFVASWNDGIIQLKYNQENDQYQYEKSHNYLTSNGKLNTLDPEPESNTFGRIRIRGAAFDQQGDLWVSNSLVENGLARLKTNGQWQSYDIKNYSTQNHHLGELIIDDYNQKWFIVAKGGGIIVYNDNNTPDLANDDSDKHLSITQGQGGLPSNLVLSLAKDKDGEIWVGTDKGIAVFYNPESIFQEQIINSQQILVEVDGYVEPILDSESITAIAIDGANRKWIGTQNSGLFLYSEDGTEQIHHFTQDNSPLFSNTITDLAINGKNGEVFVGTSLGLISYQSGAIEGQEFHSEVLVYPNPVREDYFGPIAIKNIVNNGDVRITDINGGLVAKLNALGGQAVWNGLNRNGERVSTGVYLVFSTNEFGTQTNVAKILFIK